ncbi:MAG: hypothetical protein IJB50_01820 [Clostridia bacterium]|nr:hypothetical protein [Clostridia bacterium]
MVALKGSPKGIMILIDEENINVAAAELKVKLLKSAEFFNEEELEVFMTSTTLTEVEVYSLRPLVEEGLKNTKVIFIEHTPKLLPKQHSILDELGDDEGIAKFVRTTVKSGEVLESSHNLIIIGDVERGAVVRSDANIFILGSLYGTAVAGMNKKTDSVIVAMRLMAEKIEIADVSTTIKQSPLKKFLPGVPEIAYILGDEIKIEQYT